MCCAHLLHSRISCNAITSYIFVSQTRLERGQYAWFYASVLHLCLDHGIQTPLIDDDDYATAAGDDHRTYCRYNDNEGCMESTGGQET